MMDEISHVSGASHVRRLREVVFTPVLRKLGYAKMMYK